MKERDKNKEPKECKKQEEKQEKTRTGTRERQKNKSTYLAQIMTPQNGFFQFFVLKMC